MFEARHTMDAPATTSADNGTSGGGDGWFKPRKQPASGPDTEPQGPEQRGAGQRGTEPQATEGRRLAGLRPVGRGTATAGAGSGTAAPGGGLPQDVVRPDGHHPDTARPDLGARITAPPAPAPSDPATTVLPKLIPAPATAVPPLVSTARPSTDTFAVPESLQVPAQRTAPGEPLPAEAARMTAPPEEQHRAEGQHRAENPLAAPHPEPGSFRQFAGEAPRTEAEPDSDLGSDPEFFRPFVQELQRPEAESAPEHSRPLPHEATRPEPDPAPEAARPLSHEAPQAEAEPPRAYAPDASEPGPEPSGSFVPDAFRPAVDFPRPSVPDVLQDESPEAAPEPFRAFGPESLGASEPAPEGSPDAVLVRRTMAAIGEVSDKVTSYFYALLFVRHPDLRPLFPPAMDAQRDRLLKALLTAAEHVDNAPVLVEYLQNLGRGHRKYGTRPEHYPAVGECLIGALAKYAESVWNPETEAAWVRTYTTISQVMIDAAAVDELRAPPWWQAEVVSHELRTQDIAVITVRPNQPYPFLAGQYASLETPWWPRIWRHYSFASAPRSDGLLSFHVKAVPAGWVSNALVHRAQPGDVIRLGPPAGTMTVDHTRDSGLLCLGGGTGIAPIKALVEDVAEHGTRRRMEVFYGARTDHDLYDIDTMLRLQQSHSWLEVRPVVDKHGLLQLPDAIRTFGPWDEYDAYLSGPVGMIRSGVDALRGAGIPKERIRHDSVAELVAAG
ncbi:globin domain-containing protein [Streptomyces acidiscabies]|uniref:globin domain-containing protein n=1 Tax=Streptomyces acidiscabies TaxID=42234 RepID=UPI0038F6B302